ncbi:MAG TPA: cytochrome c oxidase assembly protein [Acidimicrobiales bacterium]|nr:cytochrome c oxidase assembly protein [Acidimicrobiales bacterium]
MIAAAGTPFDWHLHLVWLLVFPVVVGVYLWGTSRTRPGTDAPAYPATLRQKACFVGGVLVLVAAVTWPLGDLAAHWLLLALVLQRLLLTLVVPPLLVLGTPRLLIARLTRPAPVDAVLRVAVQPAPAVLIVTVVAVATLTTGAVSLAARSDVARVLIELLVLASGFVLWAPVLTELPGAQRLSALGRGGYLIVQSIVPSFLSIVWIFARHSLYPPYAHRGTVVGLSPLLDQQLAGFLAKLSTIAVLWTVAFVIMTRAQAPDVAGRDEPLMWSDVEREIERADRRERRHPTS